MSTTPFENQKINTRQLAEQLVNLHGSAFSPLMHPEGHLEGVLVFGPPGIGKTQSSMEAAREIAEDAGSELVIYKPGIRPNPNATKPQTLFVHMSMAGMTSGGVLGFPTVSANDKEKSDPEKRRFVSQQVIPEIWRAAKEFDQAIYLFDEITHVISQEALLSLLSEGFYGETELAKRTLFIATANEGVSDGTMQQKLSTAFRNRFTSYYIRGDVKQWRKDFANKTVHPALLAYTSMYPDRFEAWKTPEHNLLNAPTLRGVTLMSDALTFFEARNFRKRTEDGKLDPRGEWKEVAWTPDHTSQLSRLAFGRLGHEAYALDFVNMYELAYKTVMPEIQKAIAGKVDTITDEFKRKLNYDTEGYVSQQKSALSGKSSSEKLKESQNDIAIAFTYVDYTPRMFLDALLNLPNNPRVLEHARKSYPGLKAKMQANGQKVPDWKEGEPCPGAILRTYGHALLDNFFKGIMLLPTNMQMMAIEHLRELSSTEETKKVLTAFHNAESNKNEDVVLTMLLQLLTQKQKDPTYERLYKAFHQNMQAVSVINELGAS